MEAKEVSGEMKVNPVSQFACRDVKRLADRYVDGELAIEISLQIVEHLQDCPACRALIEERSSLKALVRQAVRSLPGFTGALRKEFIC